MSNVADVGFTLTREQIVDLLYYLGATEVKNHESKESIQFTCTVHRENNPSAGVSITKQLYNCLSCGSCGTLDWLVYQSDPDQFPSVQSARDFIAKRYGIDMEETRKEKQREKIKRTLKRFGEQSENTEDVSNVHKVLPRKTLAPFRSGKETYKYFFDRGFNKKAMKEFEVGRDVSSECVTVPIRWEDGQLAGVVGRYIDPNRPKHQRYKVYEFKRGLITFPQDKLEVIDDTIILVEGLFDAMWMHMLGHTNTQSILGNRLTKEQAKYLKSKASRFIRMFDGDKGGAKANEMYNANMKGVTTLDVVYPNFKKDPRECTEEEIQYMLDNAKSPLKLKLKRFK